MDFNEYQKMAAKTAIYPEQYKLYYPALGLSGEAGEVSNKIKKIMRDGVVLTEEKKTEISMELSDCLWYIAALCSDLGVDMNTIAEKNIEKLFSRKERGVIGGSGDN